VEIGILVFVIGLIIGVPIAFCLGLSALISLMFIKNIPLVVIAQKMFTGLDVFPFMAVPFFILAGDLMNQSGITKRLVNFSDILVGHIKGGLANITIISSMFFAGITGSAIADASAIGGMMIPAMKKKGFDTDFSAAVTASASVVGPIIPPSIPMVIFALLSGSSVGALFLAGVFPGILLAMSLVIVSYVYSCKRKYPRRVKKFQIKEVLIVCYNAIIPLIMPIIILGGILSGIFTATEASAVAVVYSLIIGFFVYHNLKLIDVKKIFISTAKTTGMVFLVIACANIFSWLISIERIPQLVEAFFIAHIDNRFLFLLVMNIMFLILGCFMEGTAAMIITTPIFLPIAEAYGVSPIMFGAIVVLNLMIGLITPPVGLCLYVVCGISNISLERISKAVVPFLIVEIIVLLMVTYCPPITLWLPKIAGYL